MSTFRFHVLSMDISFVSAFRPPGCQHHSTDHKEARSPNQHSSCLCFQACVRATSSKKFAPKSQKIVILDSKELYMSDEITKISIEDVFKEI